MPKGPSLESSHQQAVVICTCDRPRDLHRTLASIADQENAAELLVVVVDASEPSKQRENQDAATSFPTLDVRHMAYTGQPAGTRQRNFGIEHLPPSVEFVHFIDDDVTVLPGYFRRLADVLRTHPEIGGVGGRILEPNRPEPSSRPPWLKRLFLLTSDVPGRVLPSGHTSSAQFCPPFSHLLPTQWLSTCASTYRRAVFAQYRFDPAVEGPSPRLEDLDFSYRISRCWPLFVDSEARLIHHRSPLHRHNAERTACESVVRRYWFIEKNIAHPLRKAAFWWAFAGQVLAASTSDKPKAHAWRRGLLRGACTLLTRSHPLLQSRGAVRKETYSAADS